MEQLRGLGRFPRAMVLGASGAALAAAAAVGAVPSAAPGMRVAVLTFQSGAGTAGELDNLGTGLQSMVTTNLAAARVVNLVERSRIKDVEAEVKLARRGFVDPATAVRAGKLAGATHLVTGSFTLVGRSMRLDARLVSVGDGRVVLAEEIAGERDAFFELEKQLVGKVIRSLGLAVGPKERADVARIHTADFEAFREFSDGVALFDARRYDDALAALRAAERRDRRFELATLTLAEYQRVVAELRAKASAIESARDTVERVREDGRTQAIFERARRLAAVTERAGAKARLDRIRALRALIELYDGGHAGHPTDHDRLAELGDDFAVHRAADPLWRRYVAEWLEAFPQHRIGLGAGDVNPDGRIDVALDQIDESLGHVGTISRRLLLDRREEVDLRRRIIERAARLPEIGPRATPSAARIRQRRREREWDLADNLRDVGDYAGSTAIYARLADGENEPRTIKRLAAEIDQNRRRESEIAASPRPAWTRELELMHQSRRDVVEIGGPGPPPTEAAALANRLGAARRLRVCHSMLPDPACYIRVGSSAVWFFGDYDEVATGPRADRLHTNELRYRGDGGRQPLLIFDGVARADLNVGFDITYDPPEDFFRPAIGPASNERFRRREAAIDAARPEVALVFGLRDVMAKARPPRSYELVIAAGAVRLQEVHGNAHGAEGAVRVLAEQPVDLGAKRRLAVTARIDASAVRLSVDGRELTFPSPPPADRNGFYGVRFRQLGYAAVTRFAADAPPPSAVRP